MLPSTSSQNHSITWDKYSLFIDDKRQLLIGGEFHYWRVPDKERWEDILKMYKIAGLNTLRIYFHWGFHNPAEDVFIFEGNRDIHYLLEICEQLGLYVLVAAGPYICAETNGGGYPGWLLSKKDIRIKHLKSSFRQEFDPNYMKYVKKWYTAFIQEIKNHQLTENSNGCIIGFQIENEYIEKIAFFKGSRQYMEELIQMVNELGITVPNFHNDAMPSGSWNNLVDLYGFDMYIIKMLTPSRSKKIPEWHTERFQKSTDNLEQKIEKFGGDAAKSPLFIPELQGGWYNHWGVKYGFDELYDWYGSPYQKLVLDSMLAQRVTMMSIYMFYGGTNYGSFSNPEVYTSYDYSANIREFGFLSDRLRYTRLFTHFVNSFYDCLTSTDLVEENTLTCSESHIYYLSRIAHDGTRFHFFRNFNKGKETFSIKIQNKNSTIQIPQSGFHQLCYKESYIAIEDHQIDGFRIKFCSLPIVIKGNYADGTLLVCIQNGGELLLDEMNLSLKGSAKLYPESGFTRILTPTLGQTIISNDAGQKLYLILLDQSDALNLVCKFENSKVRVAWGAYSLYFNAQNQLDIESWGVQTINVLDPTFNQVGFKNGLNSELISIPGYYLGEFGHEINTPSISLKNWSRIFTNWIEFEKNAQWIPIDFKTNRDPLNHKLFCGHILYRCDFQPKPNKNLYLKVKTRHKVGIWLNGEYVGGHYTYQTKNFGVGAMNGPDPSCMGAQKYNLTEIIRDNEINSLFIITESLGQSKNFFLIADSRNPRGLLSAKFSKRNKSEEWFISGVDSTALSNPYNTSGFPGERFWRAGEGKSWDLIRNRPNISPEDQIIWYKTTFDWELLPNIRCPLRLHLEGKHNVNIYLNGFYIGRYWGEMGPQHDFYLMESWVKKQENVLVFACWTTKEDEFKVMLKPYIIDKNSGNIKEDDGIVFLTEKHS